MSSILITSEEQKRATEIIDKLVNHFIDEIKNDEELSTLCNSQEVYVELIDEVMSRITPTKHYAEIIKSIYELKNLVTYKTITNE